MTKMHFEAIAAAVRGSREDFASNKAHAEFASHMAFSLAEFNPRFDRARFVMACMPTAWVGSNKANIWERIADAAKVAA